MENPKCRFCGGRHSIRDPHIFETAAQHAKKQKAKPVTEPVTKPPRNTQNVTHGVTKHCPTCSCTRVYSSAAEKQKAYRERKFFSGGKKEMGGKKNSFARANEPERVVESPGQPETNHH